MNDCPIVIVLAANDNYFKGLCVTLVSSLVSTSSKAGFEVYVLDTGISESNKRILDRVCRRYGPNANLHYKKIDETSFSGFHADYGGGYSTYARLLIGSLIPHSKAIYIDSDFLVLKDLSEAWNKDLGGFVLCATKDIDTPDGLPARLSSDCPFSQDQEIDQFDYFGCGFFIVDLDAWRSDEVEKRAFAQVKGFEDRLKAWDQTVLNYVLRGRIGSLEASWCKSFAFERIVGYQNIHYISKSKPWNTWSGAPMYRLWYIFYHVFIESECPLALTPRVRFSGWIRYVRDLTSFRYQCVGNLFLKQVRRKKEAKSASLYAEHLKRGREVIKDQGWTSEPELSRWECSWRQLKFEGTK